MGAEFSIEGSVSGFSPYSDVGKDIEPGETVTLKLENPSTVSQVRFDIEFKSASWVPDITLSPPSGMPAKPSDGVTFVVPVDFVASYKIRCITGDGTADGAVKSRIVAIRSAIGLRHVIVTERDEYQRPYGWAEAINETVDQTVAAVGGDITGPGASTDGAIATWNGVGGNQLRNNSLAIIPPGTGRLQLSERIELGDSPTADGLNLDQGYGVSWKTELGPARAIGIESGADLTIGDVTNIDDVVLQAKTSKAVNLDIGGTTELAVETGRTRVPNELKLTGKLKMGPTPPDGTGINLSTTQPITGETVAPDAGQAHMMSIDAGNRLVLGEDGNLGDVHIRTRTGNDFFVEIGGANKLTVGGLLVSMPGSLAVAGGLTPADAGDVRLSKTATINARNNAGTGNVALLALSVDALTLGSSATESTTITTKTAGTVYVYTGALKALAITSTALKLGVTPAPSGTIALPKTSSIRASNDAENDYVPMVATDGTDQLLIGGNYTGNKGVRIDAKSGYTVIVGIAGTTQLTVSSTETAVAKNLSVQGGTIWPNLEPKLLQFNTQRTTDQVALSDVLGASLSVTLPMACRVVVEMSIECSAAITSCIGGWTASINGVDGTPLKRALSGSNDTGALSVMAWADLAAGGPYTIQARHQRVSGTGTVQTDKVQMVVRSYGKPV